MKARRFIDYTHRDWFIHGLFHFGVFSGRAPRKAFWGFHLFAALIYAAIAFFGARTIGERTHTILALYLGAIFLPALALVYRRLHDTGRSGRHSLPFVIAAACAIWHQAKSGIPFAFGLSTGAAIALLAAVSWLPILVICGFFRGNQGSNPYGMPPYERPDEEKPDDMALSKT